MTDTATVFRLSVVRLWLLAAVAHILFAVLMVLAVGLSGREVDPVALACVAVMPAFYWVVYGVMFRVTVSPAGLEWMGMDGQRTFARWDQFRAATPARWLGFPQVRLDFEHAGVLWGSWIPLTLSDPGGFADALREHAGPDHPITRAVEGLLVS
jgi:hypothetical protein